MKKWLILMALCLMTGCSVSATETGGPAHPDIIYISFYSVEHADKSQPMLINVISDKEDIMVFDAILSEGVEAELKADDAADIYYLQLDYPKNGQSQYRDFLYVTNDKNQSYIKELFKSSQYGYDAFDEKAKASLMNSIGNEGWLQLKSLLPI
ncbi:hypothetical protein A7K91_25845 [Paenibacillus oryzae]|uniref:Lipoprotein n=1 Tax=Paenibacillus oryzae TaxID=1844972 RepID=A0A1A5YID5_9BACL|nr:hypothetical protein [Paenibacillus oryzae]OBR65160.1 hypothetical protein A7K91_25845 [Paenibacillus oryzae]